MILSHHQKQNPKGFVIPATAGAISGEQIKTARLGGCFNILSSINENRIRRPILGTSEQDMVRLRTQVRVQMSL